MDKDYYTKYYNYERTHWWFRVRESILMSKIKKIAIGKKLNILNIGCATGRSSEALSQYGNVTSLEYDIDCCEFARKKTGLEIIHGSILELPFKENEFDLVCAFDVIEHIEEDQKGVSEMVRVCKSKGAIFVTVPAFMNLWSDHDTINHHFRRYKINEVNSLFVTKLGSLVYKSYFNSFLFPMIYGFRKLSTFKKNKNKEIKSDFESFSATNPLNYFFYVIFYAEKLILNLNIKFPAGVSIMYLWKKS